MLSILAAGALGCAGGPQVRYVYQDGQSGVIGMPENSSRWPTYYRKHAEELMQQHFPGGYEIVRAEEVVEGSRTLTIKGSNAAEIEPGVSSRIVSVGKLGRTSSRSQSDTLKIKECRIVYKKADEGCAAGHGDFAAQASWTPAPYVDPNSPESRAARAKEESKAPAVAAHPPAKAPPRDGADAEEPVAGRTADAL